MACPDVSPPPDAFTKFTGPSRGVPAPLYVLVSRQAYSVVVSFVRADLPHSAPSSYPLSTDASRVGAMEVATIDANVVWSLLAAYGFECLRLSQWGLPHSDRRRARKQCCLEQKATRNVRFTRPRWKVASNSLFSSPLFCARKLLSVWHRFALLGPSFIDVLGSGTVKTAPIFSALSLFIILSVRLPLPPLFFFFLSIGVFLLFFFCCKIYSSQIITLGHQEVIVSIC